MKKLILSVIFMLSVTNSARAYRTYDWTGWDTNAWPSTVAGKVYWSDTNKIVNITNIWAYQTKTTYTATNISYASYALPNYSTNGYAYDIRDYIINSWPSVVSPIGIGAMSASNHFMITVTSKTFYAISTNYYVTSGLLPTGSELFFPQVRYNGNTFTIQETLTRTTIGWRQTNLLLNASDIRGFDCYVALNYLDDVVDDNVYSTRNLLRFTYRNEWENLKSIKATIYALVNKTNDYWYYPAMGNVYGYFTNKTSDTSSPFYVGNDYDWIKSNLPNAPTNFLRYTPVRGLDGRSGLPRVLTNYYTIRTDASGIVTQNFTDYLGNTNQAIGTNGQEISIQVTNSNVQAGYTTADYGWKYTDDCIAQLRYVRYFLTTHWANTNLTADSYRGDGYAEFDADYATALADAQSDWHTYTNCTSSNFFKNVGTRFYGGRVRTGSRYHYVEGNYAVNLIKETAQRCVTLPVFPTAPISNRAATVYLYYRPVHPVSLPVNWTYTNSLWEQLNPTNRFNFIDSVALPTNVAWGTGGPSDFDKQWLEFTATNGVSSAYNADYPPVSPESATYKELGWRVDDAAYNDATYIIFDWQHPWVNVITN